MACMYIRLPHYVASFWRNRDERKPIAVGGRVDLSGEYVIWQLLQQGLVRNPDEEVAKNGCFCERMWRKMLRGQSVVANEKGRYVKVFPGRDVSQPLSDGEVQVLAKLGGTQNDGRNEYLCVELPSRVFLNGVQYAVDGQWQLRGKAVQQLVNELKKGFWHECVKYVGMFLDASPKGVERSANEGLDRFLMRYDIRVGLDNKERKTLKRNYYRQLLRERSVKYDFEEFGETK